MTTTVVARGAEWSSSTLHDGWGDNISDGQIEELGKLVVGRFEDLAKEAGYPVHWFPATSEVHGSIDLEIAGDYPDNPLNIIQEQAVEEIWQAVIGNGGPMEEAVAKILEEVTD